MCARFGSRDPHLATRVGQSISQLRPDLADRDVPSVEERGRNKAIYIYQQCLVEMET